MTNGSKTESFEKLQAEITSTMDFIIQFQNDLYEIFDMLIDSISEISEKQDIISKALEIELGGKAAAATELKEKVEKVRNKEIYI